MDLLKITKSLKPVKGQRLADWLGRFLTAPQENLAQWQGKFTEVITAKAVEILRKRGIVEEHEASQQYFGSLLNAAYRAPVFDPLRSALSSNNSGPRQEAEVPEQLERVEPDPLDGLAPELDEELTGPLPPRGRRARQ